MLGWLLQNKKFKKIVTIQFIFLVAVFLFLPAFTTVKAQGTDVYSEDFGLQPIQENIALGAQDIRVTIAKIIRVVLGFLGTIALVLILYAGYTIMTSAGNEQKVATGKKILLNATIGLAIIMSAFAITQFVLNKLAQATGYAGGAAGGGAPGTPSFTASGSLGAIVKDHYPFRNQIDVARNTRITVTFFMPLQPESVIFDTNADDIYGDCNAEITNWWDDCDQLNPEAIEIYEIDNDGNRVGAQLTDMNVLAVYEDGSVYTLVLRPVDFLGDSVRDVSYSVNLTSDIMKEGGGESMFSTDPDGRYEWRFRTGTELDLSPPKIVSVYPRDGQTAPRNTAIQINFSEPVDPSVVQGSADTFTNIIFDNNPAADVEGYWRVSSGYKTVEFVSYDACGENSCGDPMYCIPTTCPTGDELCSDNRQVLVRTAELVNPGSFEAVPFSGVVDMAGNALDGNADNAADGKPAPNSNEITADDANPDNYIWGFAVQNVIDRTAPYIISVLPNPDDEDVPADAPFRILFSKPMLSSSLSNIKVEEYPFYTAFWFRATSYLQSDDTTLVSFNHRAFGPDDMDLYYFTSVDTKVKSLTQNCLYPGRGPEYNAVPTECVQDEDGNVISGCADTTYNEDQDTACVFSGATPEDLFQPNVSSCLDTLKRDDVSPVTP